MIEQSGKCLCETVQVAATLAHDGVQLCHCKQCQRWTGGGPLASVKVTQIEITGAQATQSYRASDWGERVFCGICGSTLWWKMAGRPIAYIAVGLLDDQSGLSVAQEIFVDHRPGWLPEWSDATQRTEAEELAALHAYLEGEAP